jgi:hypothetical protein
MRNFFDAGTVIKVQKVYSGSAGLISRIDSKAKEWKGKMRTGSPLKMITLILVVLALMSATAFAFAGKPPADIDIQAGGGQEPAGQFQQE